MSDVNEIPRADVITALSSCKGYSFPVTLEMPSYTYDFGCIRTTHALSNLPTTTWRRAKVVRTSMLGVNCGSSWMPRSQCVEQLALDQNTRLGRMVLNPLNVLNSGWHVDLFNHEAALSARLIREGQAANDTHANHLARCMVLQCRHPDPLVLGTRQVTAPRVGPAYIAGNSHMIAKWYPDEANLAVEGCLVE